MKINKYASKVYFPYISAGLKYIPHIPGLPPISNHFNLYDYLEILEFKVL